MGLSAGQRPLSSCLSLQGEANKGNLHCELPSQLSASKAVASHRDKTDCWYAPHTADARKHAVAHLAVANSAPLGDAVNLKALIHSMTYDVQQAS